MGGGGGGVEGVTAKSRFLTELPVISICYLLESKIRAAEMLRVAFLG